MTKKRYCIALLLTMLITLTASATAYDATSVKMCTSAGDISMVRIGMTADSCGIWVCRNVGEDVKNVRWKMDDMVYITNPTNKFVTNTLYQLANYTSGLDRAIAGDSTVYVYLRAKSQDQAQCFLWDGNTMPSFASKFHITGSVTAEVTDGYKGDNCYIHQLKYQASGISEDAFDHLTIEKSNDGGTTWTTVNGYITDMSATLPIMLSLDETTVRYRVTAHVKDGYQAVLNDSTWTYQTSNYRITPADRVQYKASKVLMKSGNRGSFRYIYHSHLGTTKEGYQIWGAQGQTNTSMTHWEIDDVKELSADLASFKPYTIYLGLSDDYPISSHRYVNDGTQWYHFVKVNSSSSVDYFSCNPTDGESKRFHPYSFYLYAYFTLGGKEIFVNHDTHTLQRQMSYEVEYIDGKVLDSLALYASCDQGQTWKQISALTTGFNEGTKAFNKSELVNLPSNGTSMRYRIVAYAKDAYKMLSDDGKWVYETTDTALTFSEDSSVSSITVDPFDQSHFKNPEGTSRGVYWADISWNLLSELTDQVDSIQIQYSTDHGKSWTTVVTTNNTEGTDNIWVPAGYASYLFRAVPFLKGDLANVPLLSQPITSTEQTISYSPEVTSLTATETRTEESCGRTLYAYAVRYVLNTDLYRTRREASISYSYDDGQHWYQLQSFVPNPSGEQIVKVDGRKTQCRFRIDVRSSAYDDDTFYTKETPNITFE